MGENDEIENNPHEASSASEKPITHNQGGRPKGKRNYAKVALQLRIQKQERVIWAQLLRWIKSDDGMISLAAIKMALAYGWGKPPEKLLIGNEGGKPFVIAAPQPVETYEAWERLVTEAESIAANANADHS